MRHILIVILSIFSFVFTSMSHAENKLQTALDKARIKNNVTALQMTIIMPDKDPIAVVSGKTTKAKNASAVTPNTLFQIGSNTKSFIAAALLKLQEAHKLNLNNPLNKYYPQYRQWAEITISEMLHNNSGIPSYSEDKKFQNIAFKDPEKVWSYEDLINLALKRPLEFKPGKGWHYSNTNFILAGMIAEKVSGKPVKELFQDYFFKPSALNLSNTYYSVEAYPSEIIDRMAHGISEKNRDVTADNLSWGRTAGAIVSNANDLAKWTYDLFHGKVLSKESLEQMMTTVSTQTGEFTTGSEEGGYGLGVGTRVNKDFGRWWGHEGHTLGYHSVFIWYPKHDIVIAINANGEAPYLREFAESIPGLLGIKAF